MGKKLHLIFFSSVLDDELKKKPLHQKLFIHLFVLSGLYASNNQKQQLQEHYYY